MKRNFTLKSSCLIAGILLCLFGYAQDQSPSPFKVTADLVSSYVWRGVPSTSRLSPNFQPTLAFLRGGLEAGVWGSTDFLGEYKEADPYLTYSFKNFKVGVTDYNWNFRNSYFNYKNKETDHIIEGTVGFTGTESLPLSITVNTMLFGSDHKYNRDLETQDPSKNAYSTYVELGYTFLNFSAFLGATPADGYYGDSYGGRGGFALVNMGISATKSLKITDVYSLPLKATFGLNPQSENTYFVFGITF